MQDCTGCQEEISPGSVVVMAARLGDEVVWHPQCFRYANSSPDLQVHFINFVNNITDATCAANC